jgi:putative membrane protein
MRDMDNSHKHPLILRDDLAVHRTTLANERTLLSYMRTALTLFVAGVTFIKFFDQVLVVSAGWLMIPVSILVMAKGVQSYREMAALIRDEIRELSAE